MTHAQAERRRRFKGWAAAVSLVAHAFVLLLLGWAAAPRLGPPATTPRPDVLVTLSAEAASVRASGAQTTSSRTAAAQAAPSAARPSASAARAPSPLPPGARPATNAPPVRVGGGAPGQAAAGATAGSSPTGGASDDDGDVRGFLRATVGCDHRDGVGLTRVEREHCNEIAGARGQIGPRIGGVPDEKRAYYDQVAAAYAAMRYPTPVARGPAFGTGAAGAYADPPTAMPGHMPGIGCRLPLGKPRGWKGGHDGPAHSLKLGPCFISPPQGVLTEEADVRPPASLRERTEDAAHMKALDAPSRPANATGR